MENVAAFNNELSGLYDSKPPISKAKMAAITKSAMRAIKFYKHVVQSVEKFILKCKPEYKVPGLYVIDSIVRQSRHQFGAEKDVFAPRFARNIKETFANLFRCAPEDKSRIIRVLNLWQKNNVFAPEVIQPIFDLADPNHPIYQMPPAAVSSGSGPPGLADMSATANGLNTSGVSMDMSMGGAGGSGHGGVVDDKIMGLPDLSNFKSLSHEKAQNLLGNSTLRQLEHMQQYLKRQTSSANPVTAASSSSSSKARDVHTHSTNSGNYCNSLEGVVAVGGGSYGVSGGISISASHKTHSAETGYSKYNKTSHDFNYDVGDVEDSSSPAQTSNLIDNNNLKQLLNDPNVLRQLQTLQNFQKFRQQEDKQHKLNEMRMQEEAFEKHLQNVLKGSAPGANDSSDMSKEVEFISEEQKIEVINLDGNDSRSPSPDRDRYKRRRSRSRSRSRDRGGGGGGRDRDRRRRTRSRSRSRSPRSNRRRSSRDRDRNDRSNRDKDKEKDREHERERRKKGLPDLKKEHLSVCSTTLWVGHLSKLVYQEELSDTFGEYGDIVSIDQIVPRGCAFIVMNRRQDAHKAMQSLKNHKLQGRAITISWAAGKGVKSKEWKDFWDLELGVTYIPWNKLDDTTDLDSLEEGGMFDEDSMPAWMKDKINQMKSIKEKGGDVNANAIANANLKTNANTNTNTNPNTNATVAVPPPNLLFGIDTTQPPPGPPGPPNGPPPMMSIVPGQFSMAPPMGAPPRPMLGPMGVPLSGIPMPPNMVPGMPPSHPMMMGGMMPPPGFPPIPGGAGQIDKNRSGRDGGGPLAPPLGAFMPMGHMGLPPGATQFPPPPTSGPGVQPASSGNVSTDDQMDIEMDEDDGLQQPPAIDFNLPPPLFPGGGNVSAVGGATGGGDGGDRAPDFVRERRGGPGGSRWGGRGGAEEEATDSGQTRWHENGGGNNAVGKFGGNGGPQNFGEVRGRSGPMNIPPLDLNNPPQRPEFMDEFENRGRGPPARSGNQNGEFFPNMQNRFNQPTSLLQMRIPPPNSFNSRMGGPPMFMRGQGGAGGPTGGRQQGPGGFFNERQQFDRDGGRGAGGGGRGGRGGGRGGRGGTNNWRDERDEEDDGIFKRRNAGGPGGNRFRDRDGPEDRHSRDRERGGRRGANERTPRDRNDRERRDSDRDRGNRQGGNRRNSRDDRNAENSSSAPDRKPTRDKADTEDDWDRELAEYDAKNSNNVRNTLQEQQNPPTSIPENNQNENINEKSDKQQSIITETHERDANHKDSPTQNVDDKKKGAPPSASALVAESTPLYDELPPPNAAAMPPKSVSPHQAVEKSEPLVLQAPPLQASPSEAASVMAEAFKPPKDTPAEAESTKGHDTSEIVGGDAGASAAEQTN